MTIERATELIYHWDEYVDVTAFTQRVHSAIRNLRTNSIVAKYREFKCSIVSYVSRILFLSIANT